MMTLCADISGHRVYDILCKTRYTVYIPNFQCKYDTDTKALVCPGPTASACRIEILEWSFLCSCERTCCICGTCQYRPRSTMWQQCRKSALVHCHPPPDHTARFEADGDRSWDQRAICHCSSSSLRVGEILWVSPTSSHSSTVYICTSTLIRFDSMMIRDCIYLIFSAVIDFRLVLVARRKLMGRFLLLLCVIFYTGLLSSVKLTSWCYHLQILPSDCQTSWLLSSTERTSNMRII